MKHCKNCGSKLRPRVSICTQCGTKRDDVEIHDLNRNNHKQGEKRKPILNPNKARIKKFLTTMTIIISLIAVILVISYFLMSKIYSPDEKLAEISEAVEEGNGERLAEAMSNTISTDEANAYIDYINSSTGKKQYLNQVKSMGGGTDDLKVVEDEDFVLLELIQSEEVLFLFNEYDINIPQYRVNILSEIENGIFTYNHGDKTEKWDTSNLKFNSLLPGIYNIKGITNIEGEEFDSDISIDFSDHDSEKVEGLFSLNAFYADLDMEVYEEEYDVPLEDVKVYINDQSIDVEYNEGIGVIGPLNYNRSYEIAAEVKYEGKDFKTNVIEINHTEDKEVAGSNYAAPLKFNEESIKNHIETLRLEEEAIAEAEKQEREEEKAEKEQQEMLAEMEEDEEDQAEFDKESAPETVQEMSAEDDSLKSEYLDKADNLENEIIREAKSLYAHDMPHGFYGQYFEEWDMLLNEVWGVLSDTMPNDAFKVLKDEQIEWIQVKEGNFNEAPDEPASERSKAIDALTEETKDRTYYLIEDYMN